LPAYGRKMMVAYPGQRIVCGRCFELDHVRKVCSNENVEWMQYVKVLVEEEVAPREMFGSWIEILDKL